MPRKPGWRSSIDKCKEKGASLAYWRHWEELAFFYNAFQSFKQTLSSADYFMVFMNMKDQPFPQYGSNYIVYRPTIDRYFTVTLLSCVHKQAIGAIGFVCQIVNK